MPRLRWLGLILACLSAGNLFAQTSASGNIEGVVTDTTGGVLPGVTVVVRNEETNASRPLVTDAGGRFRAGALPSGRYEVSAALDSFETWRVSGLVVQVGQTVSVDPSLRPAGLTETVTVSEEAPLIDTRRTDVSNVISETAIQNLPINGRRWESFVLLSPGVTNDGGFGLVSYRGISGLYNNNTVDGVDNNQAFFSEARGRTRASYSISQSSIKEFQVGISNFSAEFGRAAGGSVNAVTKSGTNEYHGEAFYFLRDDKFQARDPFASFKPDERRQQFGAGFGGPLKKDKAFFFVNYDQQKRNFPYFVTVNPTFLAQACTAPGCAATRGFFEAETKNPVPREGNNNVFLAKVDYQVNQSHRATIQYNRHRWDAPNGIRTPPTTANASSDNGTDIVKTDFVVASLSSVLSPRLLNELRVQYGRDFEQQIPNVPNGPSTTVTSGFNFGMPDFLPRQKYPFEKRYQVLDSLTVTTGAHSVKIGFDINHVQEDIQNLFRGGGVYSYSSLQNIAADCPAGLAGCTPLQDANTGKHYTSFTQAFDLRPGLRGDAYFTSTDYNAYAQDTWRVNRSLTLNLGVRYEFQDLPQPGETEVNGQVLGGNPRYPATQSFNQDKNNFGPRVGFTYDLGGRHETVVRGGWGRYYGRTSNSYIFSALTNNAVTFATYVFNPGTAGSPTYPNILSAPPTTAGSRPSINLLSPEMEQPEIDMGELTIDQSLGKDFTVSASYLYSKGKKLPVFVDTNLPDPNATVTYLVNGQDQGTFPFFRGARPDTNIGGSVEVRSLAESTYHALVLQAQKRYTAGLLLSANYTLSKARDNGQNSTTFISGFSNLVNPKGSLDLEEGPANTDRRHKFVGSFHYAPSYAWGFQLGGIVILESGLPVNPEISGGVATAVGATDSSTTNGSGGQRRAPFLERNSFRGEGRKTIDLRLSKSFKIQGRYEVVALAEGFNVLNSTNFTGFQATRYRVASSSYNAATNNVTVNLTEDAGFLVPNSASSTVYGPRDVQLGLKFLW